MPAIVAESDQIRALAEQLRRAADYAHSAAASVFSDRGRVE